MRWLMLSALSISISSAALAAGTAVLTQSPSGSGTILLSSGNGNDYDRFVFDNFKLSAAQDIGRITWRGGYLYGTGYPTGPVLDFSVSIYPSLNYSPPFDQPDIGAGPTWRIDNIGGNASESYAGVSGGMPMYDYTFTLPTKFHALADTQYWLRIGAFQVGICGWGFSGGNGGDGRCFESFVNVAGGTSYVWRTGDAAFTLWTTPPAGTWKSTGGGNWGTSTRWLGDVPNAIDATATFGSAIESNATITVNLPVTVGTIVFDNAINCYSLAGSNAITLDVSSGQAGIVSMSGSHVISAPLVLNDDTTLNVSPATGTLVVSGPMSAGGHNITKSGAGLLQLENVRATGLAIDEGAVRISSKMSPNSAAGCSVITTLAIAPGAQLDLTHNAAVVDYPDLSRLMTIQSLLQTGFAAGAWDGDGIVSSLAATSPNPGEQGLTAIGYAESGQILGGGGGSFAGQSVDDTAVLLKYTYFGDANLSGNVDLTDFTYLAAHFNKAADATWLEGDFNYDGAVDLTDFTYLAANFNRSLTISSGGTSVVPEPAALLLTALAGIRLLRRRRRGGWDLSDPQSAFERTSSHLNVS